MLRKAGFDKYFERKRLTKTIKKRKGKKRVFFWFGNKL